MVILYQSQTLPINSPSASPTLSIDQVWEVMLLKCRKPELFVAPISGSAVIEETPTFMKREVDFYNLNSGAFIDNTVSQGKDETDLYLTFYFEWPYPDMQEGSKEAKEMSDKLWGMAKKTIQYTIDYARDMAKEAKLRKGLEH